MNPASFHLTTPTLGELQLHWLSHSICRVSTAGHTPSKINSVNCKHPLGESPSVEHSSDHRLYRSDHLTVKLNSEGGLEFRTKGNETLTLNSITHTSHDVPEENDAGSLTATFKLHKDTALYGLGQFQNGHLNLRNKSVRLIQGNVSIVNPFLVSTDGWGLLWNHASDTWFEDDGEGFTFTSEVSDGLDMYICVGKNCNEVTSRYRELTGHAPLFPRSFYGFIQSKEHYQSADELMSVGETHRRKEIPLDIVVQDWRYWGDTSKWSSMTVDPDQYGDLKKAIQTLHEHHINVMISVWPVIGPDCALHAALEEKGLLFKGEHWSTGHFYDAFNPEAREIYWKHAKEGLFDLGVDAWWMDCTEPEYLGDRNPDLHKKRLLAQQDTAAGSWARVLNAYALYATQAAYDGQRNETDKKRVFILSRSGFTGVQRHAAAVWSGDVGASWENFRLQIIGGLNLSASGIPYWTTDNGGFFTSGHGGIFPEGERDPAYAELYLRWTQFSVFCPLMRSHGTQTPREIWNYGETGDEIFDALKESIDLRMRLIPYHYDLADRITHQGGTQLQPLGYAFPDDPATHEISDQLMDGPSLMVAPVIEPTTYFPSENCDVLFGNQFVADEQRGYLFEVYNGTTDTDPVCTMIRRKPIDYSWDGALPPDVTSEHYTVEISGGLTKSAGKILRFRFQGTLTVWMEEQVVIQETSMKTSCDRIVQLPDEDWVGMKIQYVHTEGGSVLKVGYDVPLPERTTGNSPGRDVYLPKGNWFNFWTGGKVSGGGIIREPTPLSRIPVFVPEGTLLPLGPLCQWHDEKKNEPIEIRIYAGKDAYWESYQDDGDGYDYEKGGFNRIQMKWDDSENILHLSLEKPSHAEQSGKWKFTFVKVSPGKGAGLAYGTGCLCTFDGHDQKIMIS
jgi:alpha-D-xyloside xylohydrolase